MIKRLLSLYIRLYFFDNNSNHFFSRTNNILLKVILFMAKEQMLTADQVIELTSKYLKKENVDLVRKAYEFANEAHEGQFRKSGEPYIVHPVQVAGILAI